MAQDLLERFTALHTQPFAGATTAVWTLMSSGHRALVFPDDQSRTAYFYSVLSSLYNGSGIRVTLVWSADDVLPGVEWSALFWRLADGIIFTGNPTGLWQTVVTGAPSAAHRAIYSSIDLTADVGALNGLLANESYQLRIHRNDNPLVAQDAYLHRVILRNLE